MTAQEIHNEIVNYLATNFGTDQRTWWYIGITHDVEQRLFSDHNVRQTGKGWIWRKARNAEHARSAETLLLQRGHDGGSGGGDHTTSYVYAFRKDPSTVR